MSKENAVTLFKLSTIWRPLSVMLRTSEKAAYATRFDLNNILVYDKDGVVAQSGHGWFDGLNLHEGQTFDIPTTKPLARRVKVNLTKGEPFIIKSKGAMEDRYDLYLPAEDLEFGEPVYKKQVDTISKTIALKNNPQISFSFMVKNIIADAFGEVVPQYAVTAYAREDLPGFVVTSDEEFEAAMGKLRELRRKWQEQQEYVSNYTVEDYLAEIAGKEAPRPLVYMMKKEEAE